MNDMVTTTAANADARQAWLLERKKRLGGSEIAPILGLSRWRTAFDVWVSKTSDHVEAPSEAAERWLRRGRLLEPAVGAFYSEETDLAVRQGTPFTVREGPEPWMGASVDFEVYRPPEDVMIHGLECKTSRNHEDWGPQGSDVVPMDTVIQSNWYLAVTGMQRWDVAVLLTLTEEFRYYTIHRDEEVIATIVDRARAWWKKHVEGRTPPEIDGSDAAADWIRRRFPRSVEPLRMASDTEAAMAVTIADLRKQKKDLETREKELKSKLALSIGAAEGFEWESGKVTYREQSRSSFDSKRFKEENTDLWNKYTKTNNFRVLRIKTDTSEDEE